MAGAVHRDLLRIVPIGHPDVRAAKGGQAGSIINRRQCLLYGITDEVLYLIT